MPVAELRPSLEAVLMVADQPLDEPTPGRPPWATRSTRSPPRWPQLAEEYAEQGRGFELRNVAGGWRFYTREEYAAVVEGFVLDGQQARLTQAALETLAVVAYKQPVSRARVSAIRGVNVDGVMRTLLTRGLVEEAGQDGERGATLYRTTGYFLERIGVTSLDELPELAPYLPDMDDLEDELARDGRTRPRPPRHRPESPTDATEPTGLTDADDGLVRLQKLLAQSGVASRRKCEELMLAGLVEVDGEVVTRLGTKVDPRTAVIRVDGKRLPPVSANVYLVLNKPRGVVSTMSDPEGRRTLQRPRRRPARAALPRRPARHRHLRADPAHQRRRLRAPDGAPVVRGRQDLRRRGRRRGHQGAPLQAAAGRRDARRRPGHGVAGARVVTARRADKSIVELVIHEGRNRIVRRLLDHVGHPVRRLTRTAIGPVQLGGLKPGDAARADAATSSASCWTAPSSDAGGTVGAWTVARATAAAPYVAVGWSAYDVDLGGPGVHRGLPSTR